MKKYTVTTNIDGWRDSREFDTIEDARDYLVDAEDSFCHADTTEYMCVTVRSGNQASIASTDKEDGSMWEAEQDDFGLFDGGELC